MTDDGLRDDLSRLVTRWRSRADIFDEDDDTARRVATMCADEAEALLDEHRPTDE
jgi:hypothetical protein